MWYLEVETIRICGDSKICFKEFTDCCATVAFLLKQVAASSCKDWVKSHHFVAQALTFISMFSMAA